VNQLVCRPIKKQPTKKGKTKVTPPPRLRMVFCQPLRLVRVKLVIFPWEG
jgi:hypothetical protein